MPNWANLMLTKKGKALQAKAVAGAQLTITKMKLGSGTIPDGTSPEDLNDLIDPKQNLGLTAIEAQGNLAKIQSLITNADLADGYYIRECGVFAQDPDLGEILYAIMTDTAPDFLPPSGGSVVISEEFSINITMENVSHITAIIDPDGLVTVTNAKKIAADAVAAHNAATDAHAGLLHLRKNTTAYAVGDIAYSVTLPSWARLECVVAGTTAAEEPSFASVNAMGQYITDGSATWHVDDIRDGHLTGDIVLRHILRPGYIKANGALLSRAAYPRLWAYVTKNSLAVTEAQWSGGIQGMYSVGDGSTTFRVPDLRGEFLRGLDDGRGLDSTSFTGTTASGSATISAISIPGGLTTNIFSVGMAISGTGIPVGATIASIVSDTSITISANATASATVTITVAGRKLGSMQSDAIRNITGWVNGNLGAGGAFKNETSGYGGGNVTSGVSGVTFDVSRVVPTAPENRPVNIALIAQIKY